MLRLLGLRKSDIEIRRAMKTKLREERNTAITNYDVYMQDLERNK